MPNSLDKMTGGNEHSANDVPQEGYAPMVIFTNDSKPDLSKLQIPRLRLAQGMTPEVAERRASIGQYVLTNFPPADSVQLVPLAAQAIRQYRPDPKAPPKCYAPTGVHGIGDPGIVCADCKLSWWGPKNEKTGRSTPPPCQEGVALRAYSISHRSVVDFQFMGRRMSDGAFIQAQAMSFGYGNFVIELTSKSVKNDRGQWFEPEVTIVGDVPEDHRELVNRWYEAVMAQTVSTQQANQSITKGQLPG